VDEISTAMESVRVGVSLLGESIGLINKTKDLLPDSSDKEVIERSLAEATKASKLAESQIAMALGYKLCQCTFPPQIMLSQGYKELEYNHEEEFICPKCNKSSIEPPSKPINYKGWGGS
jgi:hypothetical protein